MTQSTFVKELLNKLVSQVNKITALIASKYIDNRGIVCHGCLPLIDYCSFTGKLG